MYEDALGGILSLQRLAKRLAEHGITIHAEYIGISDLPVKMQALESAGARVVPNVTEALREIM